MKNLEQIRAANALKPDQKLDRSAVNKLPAMILANGLLATAAFCNAEGGGGNRKDMQKALDATAVHLANRGILANGVNSTLGMIQDLKEKDSHHLQIATAEALAFISYLKRFAQRKD
jgi:CRISPR type III-B/RAMP module-associated protein Cmr5